MSHPASQSIDHCARLLPVLPVTYAPTPIDAAVRNAANSGLETCVPIQT